MFHDNLTQKFIQDENLDPKMYFPAKKVPSKNGTSHIPIYESYLLPLPPPPPERCIFGLMSRFTLTESDNATLYVTGLNLCCYLILYSEHVFMKLLGKVRYSAKSIPLSAKEEGRLRPWLHGYVFI